MRTLILLFVAATLYGQNAKVAVLEKGDSEKAEQLHAAVKKANDELAAFIKSVEKKYVTSKTGEPRTSMLFADGTMLLSNETRAVKRFDGKLYYPPLSGWEYGFEFSDDWKFLVPKPVPAYRPLSANCYSNQWVGQ